ncbi:MAG: VWA domain-containing protein [Acidobacteria bacterium]|nr:VWA domain-containing protein [Acidobacteriota bacterium]
MSKFISVLWLIFSLTTAAFAQSGRQVITVPTPQPNNENEDKNYSESAPRKPVTIYRPALKKEKKSKKDSKKPTNPPEISSPGEVAADVDAVKIETKLVTIPVSVFDRSGLYIPNLRQSDFKIFEDGKEQEIAYFGTTDKPFTVILLLDTSPSTAYKIEEIQDAAIAFTNQLKPQDNVMVIEFDAGIHVLTDVTNDRQKIYKAIRRADFGNGTSLYEAVDSSLRKRLSKIEGRKAIVLFTDGVDTTSNKATYDSTIAEAEEADALIFPIYYNTFLYNRNIGRGGVMGSSIPFPDDNVMSPIGSSSREYALGKQYLEDLSAVTGGRVFRPESTPGGLTVAFEGIAEELRRQYNIGYYPKDEGQAGQRKMIKVRVERPNLVIRSRDSYIVGKNNQTQVSTK